MWTDGKLLAWAGSTGITAVGVESGKVLAQLPLKGQLKGIPRCMWGFRLPVTAWGGGGRGGKRPEIEGGSGDECCYLLAVRRHDTRAELKHVVAVAKPLSACGSSA
jgi:hypothetical protein